MVKREVASHAAQILEALAYADDFLNRYYQSRRCIVSWRDENNPIRLGLLANGAASQQALKAHAAGLLDQIARTVSVFAHELAPHPFYEPATFLLGRFASLIPETSVEGPVLSGLNEQREVTRWRKAFEGPREVGVDPALEPAYSLLDSQAPVYGESVRQVVPYFWTLASREALAAELCALSAIEYDGLPIAFYRDMAKQAWDESRHAVYYLETAVRLMPELRKALPAGHPLLPSLERFAATGTGLPIPKERNLYEGVWNADLPERLILLQLKTETPAIAGLRQTIESTFCRLHPEIASAVEVDMHDEMAHSQIGKTWLSHLCPDRQQREQLIDNTDLLRGVFLLTVFAKYRGESLSQLVTDCSTGTVVPP